MTDHPPGIRELRWMPPSEVGVNPQNWRRHPPAQQAALRDVLNAVGWAGAALYNQRTGRLIDGHLRREEAQRRGEDLPVLVGDWTEEQERLILATLDPLSALAEGDEVISQQLREQIARESAAGRAVLEQIAGEEPLMLVEGLIDPDVVPEVKHEPSTQPGDLWVLGEHRVLCGDSTKAETLQRLLGDQVPDLVFADPPYGIAIVAANGFVGGGEAYDIPFGGVKNRHRQNPSVGGGAAIKDRTGHYPIESWKKSGLGTANGSKPFGSQKMRGSDGASHVVPAGKYYPMAGDDSPITAIAASQLTLSFWPEAVQIWWGANYYAWTLPPSPGWLVWDKDNTGNFADVELAWTNQPKAARLFRHRWNGMLKASEHGQRRVHPTQKPVALAVWCLQTFGQPGQLVFDPFLGSGIAVIAAEQLGSTTVGCELVPAYCDVIIRRWETFTGRKAERHHA